MAGGLPRVGRRHAQHFGCGACLALARFVQAWRAGEIEAQEPVTSEWWESQEAEVHYRRNVNLPPCHRPEPAP